jgi:D-alanyl-D-alanine carboxypeptidase/D-alanyl-D-alanine-endopeptidase (penicillin-binding protein 4)
VSHTVLTRLRPVLALLGLAAAPVLVRPAAAQTDIAALTRQLDTWYAAARRHAPGRWGVAIADQSGKILWGVNQNEPLIPASTVKLFTTGFARAVLGSDARRSTRVVGTGALDVASGDWVGTWALELNGDPSLERAEGSGPTLYDLAMQLASAGIRRINGPLVVTSADGPADASYPAVWSPRHRGRLFAPLIGPLMLHENVMWITVRPGDRPGAPVRVIEEAPAGISQLVKISARTRPGRRSTLGLRARPGGGWVLTGTIGVRARPRRFTAVLANPRLALAATWDAALRRAGITWNKKALPGAPPQGEARVLAEVASPTLDSLASEINRRSLNFGAELLLRWAGGREEGAGRLTEFVREVTGEAEGIRLVDGSGLSYDDRATPSAFIAYLTRFPQMPAGRNFPQLLPANGSGTLRRLASGFPGAGVVRAKTGTLAQVATVSGYLGRPEGVLVVSLMYNGPKPWAARQKQWELFRTLGADGMVIPGDTFEQTPQFGGEQTAAPGWWRGSEADSVGAGTDADSTQP